MNSENLKTVKKHSKPCLTLGLTAFKSTLWIPIIWSVILTVLFTNYAGNGYGLFGRFDAPFIFGEFMVEEFNVFLGFFAISILFSAIMGAIRFSYLTKVNSTGFINSMPVSRNRIFASYYISGIISVLIPNVVLALNCFIIQWQYNYIVALFVLVGGAVYSVGVYSFAVMMSMFSAKTAGCVVFGGFGLALPALLESFLRIIMECELFGYSIQTDYLCTKYIYLVPSDIFSPKGLIYVGAFALFTFLAWYLFKKRPAELAGDLVAFPGIRGVVTAICGSVTGLCGYLIFGHGLLMFALFGIICSVLVNFAIKKKLELKSSLVSAGVIIMITVVLAVIFISDITGFENRVPETEDIKSVRVYNASDGNGSRRVYYFNYRMYGYEDTDYMVIDYESGIETVREFHRDLIGNKDYYPVSAYYGNVTLPYQTNLYNHDSARNVIIEYTLKNGGTFIRQYRAYYLKNRDSLMKVSGLPELKAYEIPLIRDDITVTGITLETPSGNVVLNDVQIKLVRDALIRDIMSEKPEMSKEFNDTRAVSTVRIDYEYKYNRVIDESGKTVDISGYEVDNIRNSGIMIYPHYTETLDALRIADCGDYVTNMKLGEDFTIAIEKHLSRNPDDTGTKTDVYYPQYSYDDEFNRKVLDQMFSLSDVKCEQRYGTMYRITFDPGTGKENTYCIFGEVELIEEWLMTKDMKRDPLAVYQGLPYCDSEEYFVK